MKIKMITLAAGPEGIKQPGGIYDVDPKEGKALVDGGYAEAVNEPKPQQPEPDPIDFDEIKDIESFAELKADDQKALLEHLEIVGDDSNAEKRITLFKIHLNISEKNNSTESGNAGESNGSENSNTSGDGTGDTSGGQSVS